jgi:CspA family cold shock protein
MPERGVVRFWLDDEGWGVIDSPSAPGGCWAGFAAIEMPGFAKLHEGQQVWVTIGDGPQDGYDYLAERITLDNPATHSG